MASAPSTLNTSLSGPHNPPRAKNTMSVTAPRMFSSALRKANRAVVRAKAVMRASLTLECVQCPLRLDNQRAHHAGLAMARHAAVKGVGARRAGSKQRQGGLARGHGHVQAQLVNVEAVPGSVGILQSQGHGLAR